MADSKGAAPPALAASTPPLGARPLSFARVQPTGTPELPHARLSTVTAAPYAGVGLGGPNVVLGMGTGHPLPGAGGWMDRVPTPVRSGTPTRPPPLHPPSPVPGATVVPIGGTGSTHGRDSSAPAGGGPGDSPYLAPGNSSGAGEGESGKQGKTEKYLTRFLVGSTLLHLMFYAVLGFFVIDSRITIHDIYDITIPMYDAPALRSHPSLCASVPLLSDDLFCRCACGAVLCVCRLEATDDLELAYESLELTTRLAACTGKAEYITDYHE
jgi:hypothetical protein